jgi:hypothetical protein
VTFQSAHRSEPGFQRSVICLGRVVRVLLEGMHGRGEQLVEDPRVDVRAVVTAAGIVPACIARIKKRRAAARSRRMDSRTSTTWPCWSIAR